MSVGIFANTIGVPESAVMTDNTGKNYALVVKVCPHFEGTAWVRADEETVCDPIQNVSVLELGFGKRNHPRWILL